MQGLAGIAASQNSVRCRTIPAVAVRNPDDPGQCGGTAPFDVQAELAVEFARLSDQRHVTDANRMKGEGVDWISAEFIRQKFHAVGP